MLSSFQAVRLAPEGFFQRRPDGRHGWINNLNDVPLVLYHLPQVKQAVADGQTVYVAEGEKDADALAKLGLVATTGPWAQKGKWRDEYAEPLRGATVVILPDNDAPGKTTPRPRPAASKPWEPRVRILELPGLPREGRRVELARRRGAPRQAGTTLRDHAGVDTDPPRSAARQQRADPTGFAPTLQGCRRKEPGHAVGGVRDAMPSCSTPPAATSTPPCR